MPESSVATPLRTNKHEPQQTKLAGAAKRLGCSIRFDHGRYEAIQSGCLSSPDFWHVAQLAGFVYDADARVWWTPDRHRAASIEPSLFRQRDLEEEARKAVEAAAPPKFKRERARQLREEAAKFVAEADRLDERPRRERVRLTLSPAEQWRKDNVRAVYLHRALLWTPPICPRRKGGNKGKHDDRLLTPFQFAIACAVISKARVAWRSERHERAKAHGAAAIDDEQSTRRGYFRKLTQHRSNPHLDKPNIGQVIKAVGRRAYKLELGHLKKHRKLIETVDITTSCWGLLKEAGFDDSSESMARVGEAIQRLTKPVLTLRGNDEVDFPPLIAGIKFNGRTLSFEVNCHWFSDRAAKVLTPLPRKNATALAIFLFATVANEDDGDIHFTSFCKRLHLTLPSSKLTRVLDAAEVTLNQHLERMGLPKIDMHSPSPGYLKIERRP